MLSHLVFTLMCVFYLCLSSEPFAMRIVFMGTPDFAVSSLSLLYESGIEIALVVTAPDRLGGRGGKQVLESDVKKYALEKGLPLAQPEKLRDSAFIEQLKALQADVFVVVAFRMLPEVVWGIPPKGTINLHGSLLPAYRGAAPINWAIIRGESTTGVTTFLIDHSIDSGKLLMQKRTSIGPNENFGELYDRLKQLGADLLLETLDGLKKGQIIPGMQDESAISHAPKLNRENCCLELEDTAKHLHDKIRGLAPWPGAWTWFDQTEVKVFSSRLTGMAVERDSTPGWKIDGKKLFLMGTDEKLEVLEIQPQGKRKMAAIDFLNGLKNA
jgi:methionyl-tRNA formyltransferase